MEKIDDAVNEATSNITIENKPLQKKELKIIKDALENNEQSFIKTLYEGIIKDGKRNKQK